MSIHPLKKSVVALLLGSMLSISASVAVAATAPGAANANNVYNRQLGMVSRQDAVLLLVDHQVGLFTGVRDISVTELKHNVVAMAKAARALGIPVIITATMPDGLWGPTIPELTDALPDVPIIVRSAINAWDDPKVRAAIEKTGRKQLLVAGVSLEVCASLPALAASAAGYDARVLLDASGTFSEAKRTAGLQRLATAGIPVTDFATAAVEMLRDNADPQAAQVYEALDIPFAKLVWQLKNVAPKKN